MPIPIGRRPRRSSKRCSRRAPPAVPRRSRSSGSARGNGRGRSANPAVLAIIAKHKTAEKTLSDEEITDRLFLPMLLEATRVLEEGIVREPADVDMGLILGIGFPPFRGRNSQVVRQPGRGCRRRAAGAICIPGQTVSSRPRCSLGWRRRASRFIPARSWRRA